MLRLAGPLAAAAAALVLASAAQAAPVTRYVSATGSDAGGANTCTTASSPCKTIGEANGFAQTGDTISIGPGTFPEAIAVTKSLTFQGTTGLQPGGTFVDAAALAQPAFDVGNVAVTFKNLQIRGGVAADSGGGHVLPAIEGGGVGHPAVSIVASTIQQASPPNPDAWDYAVDFDIGTHTAQLSIAQTTITGFGSGVTVGSGSGGGTLDISQSAISGTLTQPPMLTGATDGAVLSKVPTTITDSNLTAFDALAVENQPLTVLRTRIDAAGHGLEFQDLNGGATVTVRDTTIEPAAGSELEQAISIGTPISETNKATFNLVGDSIFARSSSIPVALDLDTAAGGTTLHVHNTILEATATNPGGGLYDDISVGTAANWDIGTTMFTKTFGAGAPAPGSGTNIDSIASQTNTIDKGDPSQVQPGETDEAGHPRIVDGDCDGNALPDIGAFEAPSPTCPGPPSPPATPIQNPPAPPADTTAPKLSHLSFAAAQFAVAASTRHHRATVHRGTKLRFTLSEAATVRVVVALIRHHGRHTTYKTTGTVTYRKQRQGADSAAFSGKVAGHTLADGRYRATITATDAAGNVSSSHHLGFTIQHA
jgi:Bacterial Ig-like domain